MMEKNRYTVLVADDNVSWLEALSTGLRNEPDFDVVAALSNGRKVVEAIETFLPDIVVLDIIMPEYDGVYIVNHIRRNIPGYNPIIYMLSGIGSDTVITILNELDIDFYSMKPITLSMAIKNLKNILKHKHKQGTVLEPMDTYVIKPQKHISDTLQALGFEPHLLYTKYVHEALTYCLDEPDSLHMLTKVLYPFIAEKNKTTPAAVEKSIRSGIKRMETASSPLYRKLFGQYKNKKLTNSIFLHILYGYVEDLIKMPSYAEEVEQTGATAKY